MRSPLNLTTPALGSTCTPMLFMYGRRRSIEPSLASGTSKSPRHAADHPDYVRDTLSSRGRVRRHNLKAKNSRVAYNRIQTGYR